jgi:hypothetical protein
VVPGDLTSFPLERRALITFDGLADEATNPTFTPSKYGFGADPSAPTVTFEGFFQGQQAADGITTVSGNPSNPLALDPLAPDTFVRIDADGLHQLSGTPFASGPIAFLFSMPVSAIGVSQIRCQAFLCPILL